MNITRASHKPLNLLLLSALLLVGSGGHARADDAWRTSPLWDDGNAEFCAYQVSWPRYGTQHQGRALLVLVKEPWAPDLEVKADRPRRDGFDVLKLNHQRDVPTGVYAYHQSASVYVRRDQGTVRKLSTTSAESCGISTAYLLDGVLETRSYFDGQGDRRMAFPEDTLPEDALPVLLRDFVDGPAPPSLQVLPSLMAARFPPLEPVRYQLARRAPASVETPAGRFRGVEMALESRAGSLTFVFEQEAPHRLLRLRRGDGTRYELAKCERMPYWSMNRPGDEQWLPESVR